MCACIRYYGYLPTTTNRKYHISKRLLFPFLTHRKWGFGDSIRWQIDEKIQGADYFGHKDVAGQCMKVLREVFNEQEFLEKVKYFDVVEQTCGLRCHMSL
ncbi:unnamed protein product [Oncorhynchus mykiss]|uniref:Uncharacterized protein n=1 Tax=Oncorhynchus mykiss TaxID=8022 RepID=A0A060VWY4_ONCMY|nr:unnamed protein product [Oncorhynchus mykiss]